MDNDSGGSVTAESERSNDFLVCLERCLTRFLFGLMVEVGKRSVVGCQRALIVRSVDVYDKRMMTWPDLPLYLSRSGIGYESSVI